jgi:hypothetical protein
MVSHNIRWTHGNVRRERMDKRNQRYESWINNIFKNNLFLEA